MKSFIKKNLLNIGGILLSVLICFAVWYGVVFFINSNEKEVLSSKSIKKTVSFRIGEDAISISRFDKVQDNRRENMPVTAGQENKD